jgi:hypothetical protein
MHVRLERRQFSQVESRLPWRSHRIYWIGVSVNQLTRGVQVAISPFARGTARTLAVLDVLRACFDVVADAATGGDDQN